MQGRNSQICKNNCHSAAAEIFVIVFVVIESGIFRVIFLIKNVDRIKDLLKRGEFFLPAFNHLSVPKILKNVGNNGYTLTSIFHILGCSWSRFNQFEWIQKKNCGIETRNSLYWK